MDAISTNPLNLGPLLSSANAPVEYNNANVGKTVSKVASVPQPTSKVIESSQEVRDTAEMAMKDIQHFISSQARTVRISKDESSGHMVVQLLDPDSGEVIRTLPSEELLRIARSFEILGNKMVHQVA
jgi:flagellar protein FlaG